MTEEDIVRRFDDGSEKMRELDDKISKVLELLEPLPQMKLDIETAMKDSETVKDIVQTWNALKTGGRFVKWIGPIVGGAIGAWGAVKLGIARIFS